jgi:hypothetical protein
VLGHLSTVQASVTFSRVGRTTRAFLFFIVALSLLGRSDRIKELTVAARVFGENAQFDPLIDSKVRVAGVALRRRLARYYATEGQRARLRITIPVGTYAPRVAHPSRSESARPMVALRDTAGGRSEMMLSTGSKPTPLIAKHI